MSEFRGYDYAHEETMRLYNRSLPEDHRRRYAGVEALKIGFGGIAYVARVLGMSRRTAPAGFEIGRNTAARLLERAGPA